MTRTLADAWLRLHQTEPAGERLAALPVSSSDDVGIMAGLDSSGLHHVLVSIEDDAPPLTDNRSRGITVLTRLLDVQGRGRQRYIDIVCRNADGHPALDIMGEELIDKVVNSQMPAALAVSQILDKWRLFWGKTPARILSLDEQIGLFAELYFLSHWLIPRMTPTQAVAQWRGPFGSRHDFETLGVSVEVKATQSTRGRIHTIHGLDQLAPPEAGRLFLFSLVVRAELGASHSLPDLVASCRTQITMDATAVRQFEQALAEAGYSAKQEDEYAGLRLRIVDEGLFRVEDDFPRLTAASLANGLPTGLEHVDYVVNLTGFEHLMIASDPRQTMRP